MQVNSQTAGLTAVCIFLFKLDTFKGMKESGFVFRGILANPGIGGGIFPTSYYKEIPYELDLEKVLQLSRPVQF